MTTVFAGHREASMLRHLAGLGGKVRNLMTNRGLSIGPWLSKQGMAVLTALRDVGDEAIHLVGRKKAAVLSLVPQLPARISTRRFLARSRRRTRRILRRWPVRVSRVLPDSFFQGGDPFEGFLEHRLEIIHPFLQRGASRTSWESGREIAFRHAIIIGRRRQGLYGNFPKLLPETCLPVNGYNKIKQTNVAIKT
jgi:hypothetical protein